MFSAIPSVHCSGPSQPGGVMSGQRPGPSFFEKSRRTPPGPMSTSVIFVVIGQLVSVSGEFLMTAEPNGIMSAANGGGAAPVACVAVWLVMFRRMFEQLDSEMVAAADRRDEAKLPALSLVTQLPTSDGVVGNEEAGAAGAPVLLATAEGAITLACGSLPHAT